MAHDKIYGICGDKCQVDITGLIVRARFEFDTFTLAAKDLVVSSFPLSQYGIKSGENVNAIITPKRSLINTAGDLLVEVNHYIDNNGVLIVSVKNRTAAALSNVSFNIAII